MGFLQVESERVASPKFFRLPGLAWSLLVLAAILAGLWPAFAAYGMWRSAWSGVAASAVALAICGAAAALSLLMAVAAQKARQPIAGVLAGMLVRMAVPLLALLMVPKLDPVWSSSGLGEMLLGYYLAALAVETWLLVRLVPADAANVAKAT
jgi:hypothetical protein